MKHALIGFFLATAIGLVLTVPLALFFDIFEIDVPNEVSP